MFEKDAARGRVAWGGFYWCDFVFRHFVEGKHLFYNGIFYSRAHSGCPGSDAFGPLAGFFPEELFVLAEVVDDHDVDDKDCDL